MSKTNGEQTNNSLSCFILLSIYSANEIGFDPVQGPRHGSVPRYSVAALPGVGEAEWPPVGGIKEAEEKRR